jgi:ATP-dependent DNA ligase
MMVIREDDRVRLITRGGYDWSKRYPWIVESALKNRYKQFVIDGEAVILGVDGISDFNALHSGKHNDEVQLYAFDILALDGDDLRALPLSLRKTNLARLLARRPDGIFVAPFEAGEIGPDLFRAACDMGLEGLVSKRRDRPYRGGRQRFWVKVKNPSHPAIERVSDNRALGSTFSHHERSHAPHSHPQSTIGPQQTALNTGPNSTNGNSPKGEAFILVNAFLRTSHEQ